MAFFRTAAPQARINQLLPVEIKTNIFSLVRMQGIFDDGPLVFSKKHPSVIISHVCREWRNLALATPQLWADLHVLIPQAVMSLCRRSPTDERRFASHDGTVMVENLERIGHKLAAWLDRSGSFCLTVSLSVVDSDIYAPKTVTQKQLEENLAIVSAFGRIQALLLSSISRWLKIEVPIGFYMDNTESRYTHTGRILKFLQGADAQHMAMLAQNLRSLRIIIPRRILPDTGRFVYLPFLLSHKWNALQDLTFIMTHPGAANDVLDLLRVCPNLIRLELHCQPNHWGTIHTGKNLKKVTLPRLRNIKFRKTPPVRGLHAALDLPVLRSFTLSVLRSDMISGDKLRHAENDIMYLESLTNWTECFGAGLTELNLVNYGGVHIPSDTWLIDCLRKNLIPKVTHLRSIGRADHDSLLQRLASGLRSGDDTCCPQLEEFMSSCFGNLLPTLSESVALDFITARSEAAAANSVHKLRVTNLTLRDGGEANVAAELTKRGVDLKDLTIQLIYPGWRGDLGLVKIVTIRSGTLTEYIWPKTSHNRSVGCT